MMRKRNRALVKSGGGLIKARSGSTQLDMVSSLVSADAVLICDVSGSMSSRDAGEYRDKTRWEVLVDVVNDLATSLGEKLALVAFSDRPRVVGARIPEPSGGTDIGAAIRLVSMVAENLEKVVLLSDGQPENSSDGLPPMESALKAAREFPLPISVVYCGPAGGRGGEEFMKKLAEVSGGGYHAGKFEVKLLTGKLKQLLLTDGISR